MVAVDFRSHAQEWIAAWNARDLERILAHYSARTCSVLNKCPQGQGHENEEGSDHATFPGARLRRRPAAARPNSEPRQILPTSPPLRSCCD